MRGIPCLLLAGLLSALPASGQEEEHALKLQVLARLGRHDGMTLVGEAEWEESADRVLENGRPVFLRLEQPQLQILTSFTPYLQSTGRVLVVVQTEARRIDGTGRFRGIFTTVQTASVGVNEPLLFFPFGKRSGEASLALEFVVVRE